MIIAQDEIENAIRSFIRSQIDIREGMEIGIDLKASRGPEGFQAFIDIRPEGSSITAATVAVTEAAAEKPKAARVTKPAPAPVVEETKTAEVVQAVEEAAPAAAVPSLFSEAEPEVEEASTEAEVTAEEAPAPTPSLFAGLSPVKNS